MRRYMVHVQAPRAHSVQRLAFTRFILGLSQNTDVVWNQGLPDGTSTLAEIREFCTLAALCCTMQPVARDPEQRLTCD